MAGLVHGAVEVLLHEQVHALLAILHTARGIDSRPYLEDDVAHGNLPAAEPADVDDGLQAHAGVLVELLESVVGQDTVLVDDGHEVSGNAHGAEVEEGDESREGNAIVLGKGLHELEAHATAAEMLEGVGVVLPLGVEDSHGIGQLVIGVVVVADDEVDAKALGIVYHLVGLDATVEDDDELHTRLMGKVYPLLAHAVALVVAVGDIIVDIGIELLQKLVHQRHGRTSVDVVVSIDEDALLAPHGIVESVHGHVHILHEEGVDKVGELWAEESLGSTLCGDAAPDEEQGEDRAHVELLGKLIGLSGLIGGWWVILPFEMHFNSFFSFCNKDTKISRHYR